MQLRAWFRTLAEWIRTPYPETQRGLAESRREADIAVGSITQNLQAQMEQVRREDEQRRRNLAASIGRKLSGGRTQ